MLVWRDDASRSHRNSGVRILASGVSTTKEDERTKPDHQARSDRCLRGHLIVTKLRSDSLAFRNEIGHARAGAIMRFPSRSEPDAVAPR
ncbi:hypothetical protein D9Y22_13150 [Methylorubrum sp. DB1722]|nr:hypothetical protein [Methylorubrum sp. DB1722]